MSAHNGDKSRHHRLRKRNIAKRLKAKALFKQAAPAADKPAKQAS